MNRPDIAIVGAGMTRFGRFPELSLRLLASEAIGRAAADAGIEPAEIDMAFVANSMASVTTGQVAVVGQSILRYEGFSEIPVFNIDNACAGSSSALTLAVQAIRSGAARSVLVVGVEKLVTEDKSLAYVALNGAADTEFLAGAGIDHTRESVFVASVYPKRLDAYASRYGVDQTVLAGISVKNRLNAAANPVAQFTKPMTVDDVLASRQIVGPVTALMCAPIGDGASAVIVTARDNVRPSQRPIWVLASVTGMGAPPDTGRSIGRVARKAYEQAGMKPEEVDLAEVHDSISFNELLAYEELGFAEEGQGVRLFRDGATTIGGRIPVNASGGLESRGHPVAATGLAQIVELVEQLRGDSGARQIKGASRGLAENAGGFAKDDTASIVVTILGN